MGVHTGKADERGGDYFGPALNRTARLMSAGHGGQANHRVHLFRLRRHEVPRHALLEDLLGILPREIMAELKNKAGRCGVVGGCVKQWFSGPGRRLRHGGR
jgi:hypothetical protein